MAQHGYLREYDEDWDRDVDRERGSRDWRGDRDRGVMFEGRGRDRFRSGGDERFGGRDEDRGFFSRMADEARSWFSDDDRDEDDDRRSRRPQGWGGDPGRSRSGYGREHGFGGFQGDFSRSGRQQGGFGGSGDYRQGRRSFSAHPDDHYRSWRDKQIEALDRDYEDYCREREQQFHQEFDSWRNSRQQGRAGQQQGQTSGSSTGDELILGSKQRSSTDAAQEPMSATVDTDSAATLGETSGTTGRGRR